MEEVERAFALVEEERYQEARTVFDAVVEPGDGPARAYFGRGVCWFHLQEHFAPVPLESLTVTQRVFPYRVRADLQRTVERIIGFAQRRERLAKLGLATRKGVLFYVPPGTGKTHTIHYLARALPGHTTLLIAAEQMGLLGEYVTLARLFQPSVVVIEDVDLIAEGRGRGGGACNHVLLHELLNEMDGMRADADVMFILTTNRPRRSRARSRRGPDGSTRRSSSRSPTSRGAGR
jgi:hypothetical protein